MTNMTVRKQHQAIMRTLALPPQACVHPQRSYSAMKAGRLDTLSVLCVCENRTGRWMVEPTCDGTASFPNLLLISLSVLSSLMCSLSISSICLILKRQAVSKVCMQIHTHQSNEMYRCCAHQICSPAWGWLFIFMFFLLPVSTSGSAGPHKTTSWLHLSHSEFKSGRVFAVFI